RRPLAGGHARRRPYPGGVRRHAERCRPVRPTDAGRARRTSRDGVERRAIDACAEARGSRPTSRTSAAVVRAATSLAARETASRAWPVPHDGDDFVDGPVFRACLPARGRDGGGAPRNPAHAHRGRRRRTDPDRLRAASPGSGFHRSFLGRARLAAGAPTGNRRQREVAAVRVIAAAPPVRARAPGRRSPRSRPYCRSPVLRQVVRGDLRARDPDPVRRLREDEPDPLPPLTLQYADFTLWQRSQSSDAEADAVRYWTSNL